MSTAKFERSKKQQMGQFMLERVRAAVRAAGLDAELGTDRLLLDADRPDALYPGAGIDQGAFQRELEKRGLTQRIGLVVPDTQSALAVVAQTDMAALIPRRIAQMRPPLGSLKIIKPPGASVRVGVGMLTRADRITAPDLAWLAGQLRAVSVQK